MRSTRSAVVVSILAVVAAVGAACTGDDDAAPTSTGVRVVEPNAVVVRVVDGDTIVVDVDDERETVRLIGIDTPETVRPESPVECFGPEASARTEELLPPGTEVRLERDAEARDDYGRLLAYVVRAEDGLFVNLALVDGGFAAPMTFPTNTAHAAELVGAALVAERADLGLWAACGG